MARKLCLFCLAIALQASGCGGTSVSPADAVKDVTIFYLPFEGEVSGPINVDNIETNDAACRISVLARGKEAESLRRTLRTATTGGFDNTRVRVKAVGLFDEDVFIDKTGGVLFGRGGRERQLLDNGLRSVQRTISTAAKKACQPAKKNPLKQQ